MGGFNATFETNSQIIRKGVIKPCAKSSIAVKILDELTSELEIIRDYKN